jgi:hypothetical protein
MTDVLGGIASDLRAMGYYEAGPGDWQPDPLVGIANALRSAGYTEVGPGNWQPPDQSGPGDQSITQAEALPDTTAADESAKAVLQTALDDVGLGSLGGWAWQRYLDGASEAQIFLELRDQPAYKARFPYMDALRARGQAISEKEAIALERTYAGIAHQYGLPVGFYDTPDDFVKFITQNVSPAELSERLQMYQALVFDTDPVVRQELNRIYGVTEGDILANWIDPNRSLPFLTQRFGAVQSGAAAQRSGFGALTRTEAELLADIDPSQAAQGFAQLVSLAEVTGQLPGEIEGPISRKDQLDATFEGNEFARARIERRQRIRASLFAGGGQFAASQKGIAGLGSA